MRKQEMAVRSFGEPAHAGRHVVQRRRLKPAVILKGSKIRANLAQQIRVSSGFSWRNHTGRGGQHG
ncbi:hypothetical protein [Acetobacter senegalensis]